MLTYTDGPKYPLSRYATWFIIILDNKSTVVLSITEVGATICLYDPGMIIFL
jgi:hypothetical protein